MKPTGRVAPRLKQVFFDVDGTLLMAGGAGRRTLESIVYERLGVAGALSGIRLHGNTDPRILEETASRHAPDNPVFLGELRETFIARMPQALRGSCRLLPGVAQALERLHGMGLPLGVVTGNYRECTLAKLQDTGIDGYFADRLFTASDHADRPEILRHAIERSGFHASSTLYVGDTPWDVDAARACGCPVLAVATSLYSAGVLAQAGAHMTVSTLLGLARGDLDFLFS